MLLYTQEQLFDIALAEKYKDGLERGLEQGLEQGLAKGIEQSCYKIAGDLKKAEIPLSIIVSCTGLTEEEIAKL
ncbi:MAG: transposase, partial [Eubacteriales bacterium]|nr:transposase [Eubacteriales bacterium]